MTEEPAVGIEVRRDDLGHVRVRREAMPAPRRGEALLRVERFGCTANNITYAVLGDQLGYWRFFPTQDGWGRIPVWGFAEVIDSACDGLEDGVRLFGYCPMSTHMLVTPARADAAGFVDSSEHRLVLPRAYNAYRRVDADPAYDPAREAEQMLLRPLFFLAFMLDDYLAEHDQFGTGRVVLSSASSKTALATAFLLARRGSEVIGLTSETKLDFVRGLKLFDAVSTYDALDELPGTDAVFVDFAGSRAVRRGVHGRYGHRLRHSAKIGATHWTALGDDGDDSTLPGPRPAWFFAPDRIAARGQEWGRDGLDARLSAAWGPFVEWCDTWLRIEHSTGPVDVERVYLEVLGGRVPSSTANAASLWPATAAARRKAYSR